MLHVRRFGPGGVHAVDPADLPGLADAPAPDGGFLWADLVGHHPHEARLLRAFGVGSLVMEDMLDEETYPKTEDHGGYLFTVVHGLDLAGSTVDGAFELATTEIDALLARDWLITHAAAPHEVLHAVADALSAGRVAIPQTPARLLHLLLDTAVDEYEPFIDRFIPARIDDIEDELFAPRPSSLARREIYLRRRDVIRIQRVAAPQAEAVRVLAVLARQGEVVRAREALLFDDIADRLDRVASTTRSLREQLDSAFEHYHSAIATQQNEIVRVLTLVSTVLLPLTVITGIYGMNFQFMPELDEPWGYPFALTLCAAVVSGALALFRARGWIGGGRARAERARSRTAQRDLEMEVLGRRVRLPVLGAREVDGIGDPTLARRTGSR